jgi:hypothetical protein
MATERLPLERHLADDPREALPVLHADLEMLVNVGGRERTTKEYAGLLVRSGFRLSRTISLGRGEEVMGHSCRGEAALIVNQTHRPKAELLRRIQPRQIRCARTPDRLESAPVEHLEAPRGRCVPKYQRWFRPTRPTGAIGRGRPSVA